MGNLYPSWDHDLLVEAAGILKQRGQEKTLRWIGTGIDFENTRQRIQALKLERFELTGYLQLDAMNQQLRQSHCLVFPIRNKPLNLARCPFKCYQFAQAARPVITSDVGEVRAILGDLAIYVDPTPEGLADALSRVLEEPRREDIEYDLSNHRWEYRAKTLSEALLRMQ